MGEERPQLSGVEPEKRRGQQRSYCGSKMVHASVEPESPPTDLRRGGVSNQSVSGGSPNPFTEAIPNPDSSSCQGAVMDRGERASDGGQGITDDHEPFLDRAR